MWDGYLEMGGNEIVNTARALGYQATADCSVKWLRGKECGGIRQAVGGEPIYDARNIENAPWYDNDDEATARFLGVYGVTFEGVDDSTRTASVQENVEAGGTVGKVRHASKSIRVRAWLTAIGEDALNIGLAWLSAALDPESCGSHGNSCGSTDLCFFTACPPAFEEGGDIEEWDAATTKLLRRMHGVTCTSGPLVLQKRNRGNTWGYEVEFTLVAGTPWLFSDTESIEVPPIVPLVIQDLPFNLVPYPSAELAGADIIVSRNYSPNPSVETDASTYTGSAATTSGSTVSTYFTSGRVAAGVTDIAADGGFSFRGRILGNGSTAASGRATVDLYEAIPLSGLASNSRMSFTVWGAILLITGTAGSIQSLSAYVQFYNGGSTVGSQISMGTASVANQDGNVFSVKSVAVPATANSVRVVIQAVTDWASSTTPTVNSDIRIYMDAVGATIP
jgi:hypothetical protein